MRALHALTLLCAVHALQLHVPSLQQEHGGHEHLLWHAGLYCGQGPGRPALSLSDTPAGAPVYCATFSLAFPAVPLSADSLVRCLC